MKKIAKFITSKKIWIIVFFTLACVFSGIFVAKVNINYDISKYLDKSSETSLALEISEDEFGLNGNMQVMVSNIDKETSKELLDDIKEIEYVINVNYDAESENYFKDNNALYILIIDGDDYSENAKSVSNDIKELLVSYETYYGGTAIDKQRLQESITSEMVYIVIVSICLVSGLLLITSESWLEPIVLLLVAGVGVIINLGTNAFFPSVSYITNSIAAILQLALSIDYSIVLLNAYRKNKEIEIDKNEAMKKSIVEVVRPVSASSLTTLAGLCALLFMSYKIGFDIGIVLMKGIVISLIVSLTLLPGMILLLDKPMVKTHKKSLKFNGKFFSKFAHKGHKVVIPLFLVLICGCAVVNYTNTYVYATSSLEDKEIADTFGTNNQFMVIFSNENGSYENQEAFINEIKQFRTKEDKDVFQNYTSYTNTALEDYDVDKIVNKLDLNRNEAEMLLTMYNLYNNFDEVKIDFATLINYSDYLIENDEDVKDMVDNSSIDTIKKMVAMQDVLESDVTYEQLYSKLNSEPLADISSSLDIDSIKQLYGLYYYDSIEDNTVCFNTMLDFIVYAGENVELVSNMMDEATLESLRSVQTGVNDSIQQANTPMTKVNFQQYMYVTYGEIISDDDATYLYNSYFASKGLEVQDTIPYLDLMNFLVYVGKITDETSINQIQAANNELAYVTAKYPFDQFTTVLGNVIYSQTGTIPEINISNEDIQMIYILYFNQLHYFDEYVINGYTFASYAKSLYENNEYMRNQIGIEIYEKISDMVLVNSYLSDTNVYNYNDQYDKLDQLQKSMNTEVSSGEINADLISGVYIKYSLANDYPLLKEVEAKDLLTFINDNKDTNELLIKKLDSEMRSQIDSANKDLNTAEDLFKGENYSRMLISMDLPTEGEDTENFVKYLKETATKYFGEDSYIAGESVSTKDLKDSFDVDSIIIAVVTIVSILLIVAITFRSASLPIILVLVIQGACWIAFATNFLTGDVFFMSYIVASCVLMGATVDYGILMSSTYIKNREIMEKKEALEDAIKTSLPTIFTSGLILIVCGFVICFLSSQSTISSVGLLVGKGAIAAVLLILFFLPSLLYLLDKVILKSTYRKKKKKE
ncbi:MAG: efflux RND transporter permease subunit [Bacilli bacterium]